MNKKTCSKCNIEKSLNEFRPRKDNKDGLHGQCRLCMSLHRNEYRKNNPDINKASRNRESISVKQDRINNPNKWSKIYKKNNHSMKVRGKGSYRLTEEQYNQLMIKQNGLCAICKQKNYMKGLEIGLCVDHCHNTGKVRGLLCHNCNVGIGNLKDNILTLESAIIYLKNQ